MSKNSSRDWLERELQAFAATLTPGSLTLDAGAGDQVYAPIFQHALYETADFEKIDKVYKKPTFSCDLASIPVEDGRYDASAHKFSNICRNHWPYYGSFIEH